MRWKLLFACVWFSSKHQGHRGLLGQWAPRVSATALGPIPYLYMHKGGLFAGVGPLPLASFPKCSVPPISLSLVDNVLTKSMISSMFSYL